MTLTEELLKNNLPAQEELDQIKQLMAENESLKNCSFDGIMALYMLGKKNGKKKK